MRRFARSAARHRVIDTFVRSYVRLIANSASIENASFFPSFLFLSSFPQSSIVAVIVVKLAADDVVAQILNLLPVRVKSLHSSRETSTAGQVQVLQRGAILEQACERF